MRTVIDDALGKVAIDTTKSKKSSNTLNVVMSLVDENERKVKTFSLKVSEKDFHRRLRLNKEWYIEDSDDIS